ncbi:glutathione transferase GstA [Pseudomonas sp. 2FG]|uniref:glutathione transferase GstA n=1 Tax=Pseudomonas sp. 2FG TaxID=2502191 RepID=UPI0010F60EFE|nr:glutathione transferase GstA [Pseudomonas sp. 2FG]
MKLYYSPGACSLAPHIVLREAKLPFTLVRVDIKTHQTEHGADYYRINPKGYVPLLELDSGERLSEGPIVAQYIADQAGNHELMPEAGSLAHYRVLEWQNYITSELHKSFGALFNPALDAATKAVYSAALAKKYAWVCEQLHGKQYLTGDNFSVADAYLFTVTNWAPHVGLDLSDYQDLQSYLKRVAARPAVREALEVEGF